MYERIPRRHGRSANASYPVGKHTIRQRRAPSSAASEQNAMRRAYGAEKGHTLTVTVAEISPT